MHTRRSFLKSTSLYTAGILAAPSFASFPEFKKTAIGLQLYTVRDHMQEDPAGTLARVAQIGYNSVEGATYTNTEKFYGMDPKTFHALLKKDGLGMRGSHYPLAETTNDPHKPRHLNSRN